MYTENPSTCSTILFSIFNYGNSLKFIQSWRSTKYYSPSSKSRKFQPFFEVVFWNLQVSKSSNKLCFSHNSLLYLLPPVTCCSHRIKASIFSSNSSISAECLFRVWGDPVMGSSAERPKQPIKRREIAKELTEKLWIRSTRIWIKDLRYNYDSIFVLPSFSWLVLMMVYGVYWKFHCPRGFDEQETWSTPGTGRSCRSRTVAPADAPKQHLKSLEYSIGKSSIIMLCVKVDVFWVWRYEK